MIFGRKPIVIPENPVFLIRFKGGLGLTLSEEVAAQSQKPVSVAPLNQRLSRSNVTKVYGYKEKKNERFYKRLDQPITAADLQQRATEREARALRDKFGLPTPARPEPDTEPQPKNKKNAKRRATEDEVSLLFVLGWPWGRRPHAIFTTGDSAVLAGLDQPKLPITGVYATGKNRNEDSFTIKWYGNYKEGWGQEDPEYQRLETLTSAPEAQRLLRR